MIVLCLVCLVTSTGAASVLFKGDPLIIESCNEGVTIKNECNHCICTQNHVYECTRNTDNCKDEAQNNSTCVPNAIYVLNNTMCICNNSGQWPHKQCNNIFKTLLPPELEITCKPDSYIAYDCNVCRCGTDGKIDKNHCTKNKCDNSKIKHITKSRRILNNVYGSCEVKNWYSLAPCQFCFCVNENKLVCNTGNTYAHKLELGAYNLSVCGKELVREAIELIPEHQKALRYGIDNLTTEKTTATPLHETHVAIDVNREENNLKNNVDIGRADNDEYYTDSEEEKVPLKSREVPSLEATKSPSRFGIVRKESEEFEADGLNVEMESDIPKHVDNVKQIALSEPAGPKQASDQGLSENFNLGEALKLNLPMVLDKVFQMALRKSMVSIDSESECTPGAATILKCNVCFCLRANKLLCTNNVCKSK